MQPVPSRMADPRIERAILLITNRFREPLTLPDLAAGVGLSPFHLHRLFKSETGQTPAAYLHRVRLEHAAHLLVVLPDAPLLQVAIDSGFSSAATFARAFRARFGRSASDYRRAKRLDPAASAAHTALSLCLQPTRRLRVVRCALDEDALGDGYARLLRTQAAGAAPAGDALGIFVDAPFHMDRQLCRHYLALDDGAQAVGHDAFELPGGLYARLRVGGDLDALSREVMRFKTERLDPSAYALASTLAFERIVAFDDAPAPNARTLDYRRSVREMFIRVRRKHEPAL